MTRLGMVGVILVLFGCASGSGPEVQQPAMEAAKEQSLLLPASQLQRALAALPRGPLPRSVQQKKHTWLVDGKAYGDPAGRISHYRLNWRQNRATYIIKTAAHDYQLKVAPLRQPGKAVVLAVAEKREGHWLITGPSGKRYSGRHWIPLDQGWLLDKDKTTLIWHENTVKSVDIGVNYRLSSYQHGEVITSGYVLLERRSATDRDLVGHLIQGFDALGTVMGLKRKEDYRLLHMKTGKTHPINISLEEKHSIDEGNCPKKADKSCRIKAYEAKFLPDGSPNLQHYYWRIRWFATAAGPLLLSQENGRQDLMLTSLPQAKQYRLAHDVFGISDFSIQRRADGRIHVTVGVGFDKLVIEDVVAYLRDDPELVSKLAVR